MKESALKDRNSFRRHENACCYYRERWVSGDARNEQGELVLYEVYCLQGMPPATAEEQGLCFQRRTHCWRTGEPLAQMRQHSA